MATRWTTLTYTTASIAGGASLVVNSTIDAVNIDIGLIAVLPSINSGTTTFGIYKKDTCLDSDMVYQNTKAGNLYDPIQRVGVTEQTRNEFLVAKYDDLDDSLELHQKITNTSADAKTYDVTIVYVKHSGAAETKSLTDFGADATGTVSAIAALTAAEAAGKPLIIPYGTFLIDANITVSISLIYEGGQFTSSNASTLTLTDPQSGSDGQRFAGNLVVAGLTKSNPVYFGAVGNGTTDDSDKLISAFSSVATNHGLVEFGIGIFRITKTIPTTSIVLRGINRDKSLIFLDYDGIGLSVTTDSLSHFEMHDIGIVGETAFTWSLTTATSQIAVLISKSHKYIIDNCQFYHLDNAIKVYGGAYYGVIEKNLFRTNKTSMYLLADTPTADAPNEANIIFNQFDIWPVSVGGPGSTIGLKVEGVAAAASSHIKVIGNGFENVANGIKLINAWDGQYLDNRFEDVTTYMDGDSGSGRNFVQSSMYLDPLKFVFAIGAPNTNTLVIPNSNGIYDWKGTVNGETIPPVVTAWTPVDASGASLVFTAAVGTYLKTGKQVTAFFSVEYPSTADASQAKIGGLPFAAVAGATNPSGGNLGINTSASLVCPIVVGGESYFIMSVISTSSGATNANLSTAYLRGFVTYFTN